MTKTILNLHPRGEHTGHIINTLRLNSVGCREEKLELAGFQRKGQLIPGPRANVDQSWKTWKPPDHLYMVLEMLPIFLLHPGIQKERVWKAERKEHHRGRKKPSWTTSPKEKVCESLEGTGDSIFSVGKQAERWRERVATGQPGPATRHDCLGDHGSVQRTARRRSRSATPLGKCSN